MNAQQAFDQVIGLITHWANKLAGIALVLVVSAILIKAGSALLHYPLTLNTPPLDQSTGIALAALAYALRR